MMRVLWNHWFWITAALVYQDVWSLPTNSEISERDTRSNGSSRESKSDFELSSNSDIQSTTREGTNIGKLANNQLISSTSPMGDDPHGPFNEITRQSVLVSPTNIGANGPRMSGGRHSRAELSEVHAGDGGEPSENGPVSSDKEGDVELENGGRQPMPEGDNRPTVNVGNESDSVKVKSELESRKTTFSPETVAMVDEHHTGKEENKAVIYNSNHPTASLSDKSLEIVNQPHAEEDYEDSLLTRLEANQQTTSIKPNLSLEALEATREGKSIGYFYDSAGGRSNRRQPSPILVSFQVSDRDGKEAERRRSEENASGPRSSLRRRLLLTSSAKDGGDRRGLPEPMVSGSFTPRWGRISAEDTVEASRPARVRPNSTWSLSNWQRLWNSRRYNIHNEKRSRGDLRHGSTEELHRTVDYEPHETDGVAPINDDHEVGNYYELPELSIDVPPAADNVNVGPIDKDGVPATTSTESAASRLDPITAAGSDLVVNGHNQEAPAQGHRSIDLHARLAGEQDQETAGQNPAQSEDQSDNGDGLSVSEPANLEASQEDELGNPQNDLNSFAANTVDPYQTQNGDNFKVEPRSLDFTEKSSTDHTSQIFISQVITNEPTDNADQHQEPQQQKERFTLSIGMAEIKTDRTNDSSSDPNVHFSNVIGIALGVVLIMTTIAGVTGMILYYKQAQRKNLGERFSNCDTNSFADSDTFNTISYADCAGIEFTKDNSSEELYSLDNDSFLNSLEAITFPEHWPTSQDTSHTNL